MRRLLACRLRARPLDRHQPLATPAAPLLTCARPPRCAACAAWRQLHAARAVQRSAAQTPRRTAHAAPARACWPPPVRSRQPAQRTPPRAPRARTRGGCAPSCGGGAAAPLRRRRRTAVRQRFRMRRRAACLRALTHRSCVAQPRCRPRCTRAWWSCAPAMTSWRTRLAQTCVRARVHGRRRPHPSAHVFDLRLLCAHAAAAEPGAHHRHQQGADAAEPRGGGLRGVARAGGGAYRHACSRRAESAHAQRVSPADGGRARCSARAGDRHAGRGDGHRGRRRRDARARRGGTQRRFAMHTLACTHAAVAAAVC
jgi:hypothetical protein